MSKPSWDDAPEWANWLAMDGDGMWVWFAVQPYWDEADKTWYFHEDQDEESAEYADGPDESGIDWDYAFDTLEPRP